jgi:ERCC4-type nuclease
MAEVAKIKVDIFERRSELAELLEALGASVEVARLPFGDFDVGEETLVERKSVLDLHGSLVAERFWRQLDGLRQNCRYPFLLVEGRNLDVGPIPPAAIRGTCIAALRQGIRLLRTVDQADSALWLYRLACQCQRIR